MDQTAEIFWARDAAARILTEFESADAIDTANYQLCGFILAAAKIAAENEDFARRIGDLMEQQRT
jgi:hypothetical protein